MIRIVHNPLGQEHPYEQLPEERFPRQPLAEQPFKVGISVQPSGKATQVRVHQHMDGDELPIIEAGKDPSWKPILEQVVGSSALNEVNAFDQDIWETHLTAPPVGKTLTYWIEADGVESERFTISGDGWETNGGTVVSDHEVRVTKTATQLHNVADTPEIISLEWLTNTQRARRVRITFQCDAEEAFFGLGERFNSLNQRGNVMDIRVYEKYRSQGKIAYMPIPFLVSSKGYALWVDSNRWMQFDLASSQADQWTLEADLGPEEDLRMVWFTEGSSIANIGAFAKLTGPVVLPPEWTFGLWMSSNEWNSQARVEKEVNASFEHAIIPSVIVIEAWSDEATFYIWNDAQYTPRPGSEAFSYADFTFPPEGKWPNPKGMVDWLHEQNIKLVLWQIPALKKTLEPHVQQDADRLYFESQQLGVRNADGSLYTIRPGWFRGGYVWDPSNKAGHDWWLSKRAYLLDELDIDGFKTDGGEHIWSTQVTFGDGRTGEENWNRYPQLYSEAYFKFANKNKPGVTFSRAGHTGSQRAPAHWAGDEASTWEAYYHSVLAGLSSGISGIPFWSWDIGGFSGEIPTAELYLRATAMGAFCPVFQYHSEYNDHRMPRNDRTPWNIQECTGDTSVIETFRFFNNVRLNLMPYIWQEAQHSAHSGEPMMRALQLTEPQASDTQYYFGRDLLICPIMNSGVESWTGWIPQGEWVDFWSGDVVHGGQTHTVNAPMNRIPVFVRKGSSIPVAAGDIGAWGEAVAFTTTPEKSVIF